MMLMDTRYSDENGEPYKFHPQKAIEDNVALSGQMTPIVRQGTFAIKCNGEPEVGGKAYSGANGYLNATGAGGNTVVGTFLGPIDSDSYVLTRIDLPNYVG
jgi:hypothetical protein